MELVIEIFKVLKMRAEKPRPFGNFHIVCLVIIALTTIILCFLIKEPTEKTIRRLLLWISLFVIILEVYKQIVYSFDVSDGELIFNYKWHIFPWQFCSTPMFAGLAAAVIKNKKIHKSLCAYLASFSPVAGIVTVVFASDVFSEIIGVNIQTMICHGSMVVIGVFLLRSGYIKGNSDSFRKAFGVFLVGAVIAMILNEAAYLIGIPEGQVFNMYFISPYFKNDLPILAPFRKLLPDPLFQVAYIIVFSLAARLALKGAKKSLE